MEDNYKKVAEKIQEAEGEQDQPDQEDHVYAGYESGSVDDLKEEMEKIKVLCIATHILEMTRKLPDEKKKNLEAYCDKVMLTHQHESDKEQAKDTIKRHMDYKNKHCDLQSIRKISNIGFSPPHEEFMKGLYKETKTGGLEDTKPGGFIEFYNEKIQNAENVIKQQTSWQHLT